MVNTHSENYDGFGFAVSKKEGASIRLDPLSSGENESVGRIEAFLHKLKRCWGILCE